MQMKKLPEHVEAQLHRLIEEGLPADEIAFMMQLSPEVVEAEIQRLNTTNRPPAAKPF